MPEENKANRPESVTDELMEFLTDLRDGGSINMMGAVPHVEAEFGMDRRDAREATQYWMQNC